MLGVHLITRGPMGLFHTVQSINHWWKLASRYQPMRKKLSPWAHGELWAHCDHGGHGSGPNDHGSVVGEVTAQSRRGHSSVTARSQLSHGKVTAQSQHPQYDQGSVTARSQLNYIFVLDPTRDSAKTAVRQYENLLSVGIRCALYWRRRYMEWMLGCLCDLDILPHPWPWPCIFKVRFWNNVCQELEVWFSWSKRDVRRYSWAMTLNLDFHGQIFLKSHIPGMVWQIDMIWNVNYVRATSFIFDTRMDVLVKASMFLGQKMSQPEGDSNPQPSDLCRILLPF